MFAILGAATLLKLGLYFLCVRLAGRSDSMVALAEDHLNDVFSNAGAIITAAVASVWCRAPPSCPPSARIASDGAAAAARAGRRCYGGATCHCAISPTPLTCLLSSSTAFHFVNILLCC